MEEVGADQRAVPSQKDGNVHLQRYGDESHFAQRHPAEQGAGIGPALAIEQVDQRDRRKRQARHRRPCAHPH